MTVFAVFLIDDDKGTNKVIDALKTVDDAAFDSYGNKGLYFVRYRGTSRQLADRLGFSSKGPLS